MIPDPSEGTVIMWFNGDVDHDHKITLVGQGSNMNNAIFDRMSLRTIPHHSQL